MKHDYELFTTVLLVALLFGVGAPPGIAGEVTLETSDDCYTVGDTVSFTFTNGLSDTIWTPHDPPWSIWDAAGDTLIYPLLVFMVVSPIDSGSSVSYSWDQDDYLFNAVSTGTYLVQISYSEALEPWSLSSVVDTFEIKDTCSTTATLPSAWSSIKRLFR